MYRDQEPFKVGDAVFHTDYDPAIYYGLGIVAEITERGAFGKPKRVRVLWSKLRYSWHGPSGTIAPHGTCGVHCLEHAGL
tara:strand:+ start:699 stop:938 length:240 start_codon:yes stop_codon:yes gene_type:complete